MTDTIRNASAVARAAKIRMPIPIKIPLRKRFLSDEVIDSNFNFSIFNISKIVGGRATYMRAIISDYENEAV